MRSTENVMPLRRSRPAGGSSRASSARSARPGSSAARRRSTARAPGRRRPGRAASTARRPVKMSSVVRASEPARSSTASIEATGSASGRRLGAFGSASTGAPSPGRRPPAGPLGSLGRMSAAPALRRCPMPPPTPSPSPGVRARSATEAVRLQAVRRHARDDVGAARPARPRSTPTPTVLGAARAPRRPRTRVRPRGRGIRSRRRR